MQAIRLHPAQPPSPPYTPSNPAPSTALHIDNIPVPTPSQPGDLLIRIKATTIIRDMLTWPETYAHPYLIPGNDLSGTVVSVFPGDEGKSAFKPGDEVFGMLAANRPSAWAEYAVVREDEVALKPGRVDWAAAAALPLSGMTAFEALFEHGGLEVPNPAAGSINEIRAKNAGKQVLITGAAGGVGVYLVQLAAIAGARIVAASSSNDRNGAFLRELGADEVVEYSVLEGEAESVRDRFDLIVDTVGGEALARCWGCVREGGLLISVDTGSFYFVEEHREKGIVRDGVRGMFFIVRGSSRALEALGSLVDAGLLRSFVAGRYPIAEVREAYDYANGRFVGRGKIVLTL